MVEKTSNELYILKMKQLTRGEFVFRRTSSLLFLYLIDYQLLIFQREVSKQESKLFLFFKKESHFLS